jgi:hypothetical protein
MRGGQGEDIGLLQLPAYIGGAPGGLRGQRRLGKKIGHALVEQPRCLGERDWGARGRVASISWLAAMPKRISLPWASPH